MGKQIAVIMGDDTNEILDFLTRDQPHYVWFNGDAVEVYIG